MTNNQQRITFKVNQYLLSAYYILNNILKMSKFSKYSGTSALYLTMVIFSKIPKVTENFWLSG